MMYVVSLYVIYFYFLRLISSYDDKLLFKKYCNIKNTILSKLLIAHRVDQNVISKEYSNRLLNIGIFFYLTWFILFIASIIILKLIPLKDLNSLVSSPLIDSINLRFVISITYIFGMIIVAFFMINRYFIYESKIQKLFSIIFSCLIVYGILTNFMIAFGAY